MKKLVAAGVGVLLASAAPVAAAPVTYAIDQAFWGTYPALSAMGTDVWQAQRQATVDAHPENFSFLRGSVTLDWDARTVIDYALDMDIEINGSPQVASFTPADPGSTGTFGYSATGNSESLVLDMQTSWGPQVTFHGVTDEQYAATLHFGIFHFLDDGDLTLLMTGALGQEFSSQCASSLPGFGCVALTGAYDYNPANGLPTTETYGNGIAEASTVAPVPLPASFWLMLAGLGALGLRWRGIARVG